MAHAPPRRDLEPEIGSQAIRGVISELFGGDFHEFMEGTVGNLLGISRGWFLMSIFIGLLGVLWHLIPNLPLFMLAWVVGTSPIWIPVVAVSGGWKAWVWYNRSRFIASKKPMLLEMKIPRELVRSPRAMENALTHLWLDQGETTYFHRIWMGQVRPFFSFEICSFGGDVRFFVWTWASHRAVVEATLYAQYPDIELIEVEDYAMKFNYDPAKHSLYCTDWRYEPRNDAYPIRTYVEFELDKDPKEEYKIDPFAQVIEFLSSMKPTETIWIQIIITVSKDVRRKPGGAWWETESRYSALMREAIDTIRKDSVGDLEKPGERWRGSVRIQQYRQTEQIKTIDRNMGKHPFNVGMRGIYIADPATFNSPAFFTLRWIWRPFGNAQYLNQLRPRRWHNPFDYPYQDIWDIRWDMHSRRFLDAYRRRGHFYAPHVLPHNMMSTEVIASIWHPPSTSIASPGLARIPAKKASPPPNLPK